MDLYGCCSLRLSRAEPRFAPSRSSTSLRPPGRQTLWVACSHRERRPFSRPEPSHTGSEALPQSLFARVTGELPEDGQFLTKDEAKCDPMEKYCSDPYYVYESKCRPCFGTGSVRSALSSRKSSHQLLITCPHCHGLGYVRHVTSRYFPGDREDAMTLARQQPAKQVAPGKDSPNPTLLRKPPSFYKPRRKRGQSANGITPAIASGDGAGSHANGNGAGLVQPKDQVSTGSQ